MDTKQQILRNAAAYTADQLTALIKSGTISYQELCYNTGGTLPAATREAVARLLQADDDARWAQAKASPSTEALSQYLIDYPDGSHRQEARNMLERKSRFELKKDTEPEPAPQPASPQPAIDINAFVAKIKQMQNDSAIVDAYIYQYIKQCLAAQQIRKEDLVAILRRDHNILRSSVVKSLIRYRDLSYQDLERAGIHPDFIRFLSRDNTKQEFEIAPYIDRITKPCTEVYFWGIPSSGKSCALGAILSVADTGLVARSMFKNNESQGYGYMTRLIRLFKGTAQSRVFSLPAGTPTTATYEMGLDLEDMEGNVHPLTFIDLAGELVRCMYKFDAGERMASDEEQALDVLTNILVDNRTNNRKMHFFVLEYGAENRTYEGLSQRDYLDGALTYIERTGIFKRDTDSIYLIITKVDKANAPKGQLGNVLRDYVNRNYAGFYNVLTRICKANEINDGRVDIIPFSLGQVCFQDYCRLNEQPAANVVRTILSRSWGDNDTGFFNKWKKRLMQ